MPIFAARHFARRIARGGGGGVTKSEPGVTFIRPAGLFSHSEARRIFDRVVREVDANVTTVVIDLKRVHDTTTAAFATLVLLRRALLRTGRDLRLAGLHDRAAHLFGINRLGKVLPCL